VTVKVTEPGKPELQGTLIHIDDFLVTLTTQDGSVETIRRQGAVPKVEVNDPLEAHRKMLPVLSDKNIHDLTAYLVTLK
jgi:cytochrome c oxidase cbb3-type subunit III